MLLRVEFGVAFWSLLFKSPSFCFPIEAFYGQWNGTGAPCCPICGAAGAANSREAGVFMQHLKNMRQGCLYQIHWGPSRGFSEFSHVYVEHVVSTQVVRRGKGTAWHGAKNVITVWKYFTWKSGRSGWDSSTTFITTSVKNWNWSNSESFCCKS